MAHGPVCRLLVRLTGLASSSSDPPFSGLLKIERRWRCTRRAALAVLRKGCQQPPLSEGSEESSGGVAGFQSRRRVLLWINPSCWGFSVCHRHQRCGGPGAPGQGGRMRIPGWRVPAPGATGCRWIHSPYATLPGQYICSISKLAPSMPPCKA